MIFKRNPKQIVFLAIAPIFINLLILYFTYLARRMGKAFNPNPPIKSIPKIPKCYDSSLYGKDCITVGYTINGKKADWVDYTMQHVMKENGLS